MCKRGLWLNSARTNANIHLFWGGGVKDLRDARCILTLGDWLLLKTSDQSYEASLYYTRWWGLADAHINIKQSAIVTFVHVQGLVLQTSAVREGWLLTPFPLTMITQQHAYYGSGRLQCSYAHDKVYLWWFLDTLTLQHTYTHAYNMQGQLVGEKNNVSSCSFSPCNIMWQYYYYCKWSSSNIITLFQGMDQ